jgi:hypothetical protein
VATETKHQREAGDDDVVLQRPEDLRVLIDIQRTQSACAGAAAAYLLRAIAYRAGCYAPGIQELLFFDLQSDRNGGSVDAVSRWFAEKMPDLSQLGYRLLSRRVAYRTDGILDWVKDGRGYRGAVLPTDYAKLHGASSVDVPHAVAITMDRLDGASSESLVQVDPWPGIGSPAYAAAAASSGNGERRPPTRTAVAANLEAAHRDRKYAALVLFWSGYG